MPEMMELLGSTENKITKDKNGEKTFPFRNYWSSISPL